MKKDGVLWWLLVAGGIYLIVKESYTTMEGMPYAEQVKAAVGAYPDVPTALVMAVIETESSFNPDAFLADSNGGSYGLMQLDYPTAQWMGLSSADDATALYDPMTNISLGVKFLDYLYKETGSWKGAIMSYNEGPGNFLKGIMDEVYYGKVYARWMKWQAIIG